MVSEKIKNLLNRYKNQSGVKIGRDLIQPCLSECILYRRGTGTFTSSAFKSYIGALEHLISNDTKIEILCSVRFKTVFYFVYVYTNELNEIIKMYFECLSFR